MTIELRPYQQELYDIIRQERAKGFERRHSLAYWRASMTINGNYGKFVAHKPEIIFQEADRITHEMVEKITGKETDFCVVGADFGKEPAVTVVQGGVGGGKSHAAKFRSDEMALALASPGDSFMLADGSKLRMDESRELQPDLRNRSQRRRDAKKGRK